MTTSTMDSETANSWSFDFCPAGNINISRPLSRLEVGAAFASKRHQTLVFIICNNSLLFSPSLPTLPDISGYRSGRSPSSLRWSFVTKNTSIEVSIGLGLGEAPSDAGCATEPTILPGSYSHSHEVAGGSWVPERWGRIETATDKLWRTPRHLLAHLASQVLQERRVQWHVDMSAITRGCACV